MKLNILFAFLPCLVLIMTSSSLAMPLGLTKRDSSIAATFVSISKTISQLDQIQISSGQTGTPDFSKASGLLAQLAQEAESADSALIALGNKKLDDASAKSIGTSLTSSAQSVDSITTLVEKGKEWFAKNNVTKRVIQILQANIDQFHQLFVDLNAHVSVSYHQAYKAPERKMICAMVNAVSALDPKQVSSSAKAYCNGGGDGGEYDDANSLDSFKNENTPQGYESCGNSPTMFFQEAYTSKTLGSNVQCTSGKTTTPNSFKIPANALLL